MEDELNENIEYFNLTEIYGYELKILVHNNDQLVDKFNLDENKIIDEDLFIITKGKIFAGV